MVSTLSRTASTKDSLHPLSRFFLTWVIEKHVCIRVPLRSKRASNLRETCALWLTNQTWDDPLQSPYFGGRSSALDQPDPKPGPGPTSRSRWAKCGVVLLYVIGLHNLASSVVKCSSSRNPFEVLDAVSVACRTFFSAVTTHLFYRGYPCVATFLSLERGADLALSHQVCRSRIRESTLKRRLAQGQPAKENLPSLGRASARDFT